MPEVSTTFELEHTKLRLKQQIKRAHKLTERLTEQAADQSLMPVDRQSAAKRAKLSIEASQGLERSLERVEEALDG